MEVRASARAASTCACASDCASKMARRVARLSLLDSALDIVALARGERAPVPEVARAYFEVGLALGLDWLHRQIDRLAVDGSWQAIARTDCGRCEGPFGGRQGSGSIHAIAWQSDGLPPREPVQSGASLLLTGA
jgi:NAD-specific glutamate dehydrogenase